MLIRSIASILFTGLFFFTACTSITLKKPVLKENETVKIPVEFKNNLLWTDVKIGKDKYRFIIDTGSGISVLSRELISKYNFKVERQFNALSPTGHKVKSFTVRVPLIKVGKLAIKDHEMGILNLSFAKSILNQKVDGILGSNFLTRFETTIDYKNELVTLRHPENTEIGKIDYKKVIPFEFESLRPVVEFKLNTRNKIKALIDTGNAQPYFIDLTMETGKKLGLTENSKNLLKIKGETQSTIKGTNFYNFLFRAEKINFGGYTFKKPILRMSDSNINNIGNHVLKYFRFTINYYKRKIKLEPTDISSYQPDEFISSGLLLSRDEDGNYVVTGFYENSPAEKAGISLFDKIIKINGKKASRTNKKWIQKKLYNSRKPVTLTIKRRDDIMDFTIKPEKLL